jgi:hypothetical protein
VSSLDNLIEQWNRADGEMSVLDVDNSEDAIKERMKDAAKGMIKGDDESKGQSHTFDDKWRSLKDADTPGAALARDAMRKAANETNHPLP